MAAQTGREGSTPAVSCVGLRLERETQPYRCGSKDVVGSSLRTNSDSQSPTLVTNRTKPRQRHASDRVGHATRNVVTTRKVIERTRGTKDPTFAN